MCGALSDMIIFCGFHLIGYKMHTTVLSAYYSEDWNGNSSPVLMVNKNQNKDTKHACSWKVIKGRYEHSNYTPGQHQNKITIWWERLYQFAFISNRLLCILTEVAENHQCPLFGTLKRHLSKSPKVSSIWLLRSTGGIHFMGCPTAPGHHPVHSVSFFIQD